LNCKPTLYKLSERKSPLKQLAEDGYEPTSTYDSMCLGVECCLNVKLFMFLYTFKAFARYDPCQNELRLGFGDDKYTVKFDVGYDGK
jgi:hypothetical protein